MNFDPKTLNALAVNLYGRRIGVINRLGGDRHLFSFEQDYIDDPNRATLSLSFKGQEGGLVAPTRAVTARLPVFFSNLLPEGHLRDYLAERANVKPQREFFLLAVLGADLPGGLTVSPMDQPHEGAAEDASDREHEERIPETAPSLSPTPWRRPLRNSFFRSSQSILQASRSPPGAGQLVLFLHVPNHHQIDSAIGCPALCRTVAFDRTICRVARSRDWRRIEAVMLDQQGDYRSGPRRGELPVRFETGVVNRHIVSMTFDPDLKTVTSQNGYDDPHHRWVSHPSYVAQRG